MREFSKPGNTASKQPGSLSAFSRLQVFVIQVLLGISVERLLLNNISFSDLHNRNDAIIRSICFVLSFKLLVRS